MRTTFTTTSLLFGRGLFGDNRVLDFVVGGLRHDALRDQLVFLCIWPAGNDFCGISFADTRQGLELIGCGRVDIQQSSALLGGIRCFGGSLGSSFLSRVLGL